jgi:methyl-accepting chemotaxis protein
MNDKQKAFFKWFIYVVIILVCVFGIYIFGYFTGKSTGGQSGIGSNSDLITEIRQLDSAITDISKQFGTGIDELTAGITELKGVVESTGKRTDTITAGINRIERGTGKAIGYSESVIEGFTRIEKLVSGLDKQISGQGSIGEDIRKQVDILRKEIGLVQMDSSR